MLSFSCVAYFALPYLIDNSSGSCMLYNIMLHVSSPYGGKKFQVKADIFLDSSTSLFFLVFLFRPMMGFLSFLVNAGLWTTWFFNSILCVMNVKCFSLLCSLCSDVVD